MPRSVYCLTRSTGFGSSPWLAGVELCKRAQALAWNRVDLGKTKPALLRFRSATGRWYRVGEGRMECRVQQQRHSSARADVTTCWSSIRSILRLIMWAAPCSPGQYCRGLRQPLRLHVSGKVALSGRDHPSELNGGGRPVFFPNSLPWLTASRISDHLERCTLRRLAAHHAFDFGLDLQRHTRRS